MRYMVKKLELPKECWVYKNGEYQLRLRWINRLSFPKVHGTYEYVLKKTESLIKKEKIYSEYSI